MTHHPEPKPCFVCGGKPFARYPAHEDNSPTAYVLCRSCGARGPTYLDRDAAVAAWNAIPRLEPEPRAWDWWAPIAQEQDKLLLDTCCSSRFQAEGLIYSEPTHTGQIVHIRITARSGHGAEVEIIEDKPDTKG